MAKHRDELFIGGFTLALLISLLTVGPALATAQSEGGHITATVTPRDHAAAQKVTDHFCHVLPVGAGHGADTLRFPDCQRRTATPEAAAAKMGTAGAAAATGPFFFPGDVSYHGGPVVLSAQFFNLFLNSPCNPSSSCWGNPFQFMGDLFASSFIHLTDQYVGSTADGRYRNGAFFVDLNENQPHSMDVAHIQAAVIASVRALFPSGGGGGYNNVYNLFLPQGQNTCVDPFTCYSPDVSSTFTFCAYHSSMNTTDANGAPIHVVYTVEPYQNVPGCQVTNPPFPNGQLADSTNSVLSREIFGTISDPDGNAWWTSQHQALFGNEIGDTCNQEPLKFALNGNPYDVQLVYDNTAHGCSSGFGINPEPRLINISTRALVETGDDVMIAGFIIGGTTSRKVVVRAMGPSLADFGVPGVLANPFVRIFLGQTAIAQNDDWQMQLPLCQASGFTCGSASDITASGFAPSDGLEAAILITLPPGPFTAIVSGSGGSTGVGLVEVFEVP